MDRATLFHENLHLAAMYARVRCRSLPRHVGLDEIEAAAQLGLWEAAGNFDEGRGVAFRSFARWRMAGAVGDYLRATDRLTVCHRREVNRGVAAEPKFRDVGRLAFTLRDPAPDRERELAELADALDRALLTLPARERSVVRGCFLEGKTHKEAGAAAGVCESATSLMVARTLPLLREHLENRYADMKEAL